MENLYPVVLALSPMFVGVVTASIIQELKAKPSQ
jgi:hypothetical protein